MKALKVKWDRFHDHVLGEHKAKKAEVKNFVPKDMVDLLLQLADDPELEVKLNNDSVKGFIQDLIAGGTDTSATTVEWAMSELLKQPIAVMLAPHYALEEAKVNGHDIAKGTTVFINTWSIDRDPLLWDDPEEFRPERFLGKAIDVKGQSFELLPFGSGRRMCPGYSLGLKMIQSSLANLLHGFNWKLPDDMKPEDLSMDEVYGLATPRKFPLVPVTEPRLPINLY
ncbi:flavonoid 3-hydroxylase, putative [Ricinus communis]|uniref:Flavonoid 3-hydroxylase, putative n=1 Tax=Ricinus communis TaxID=3988 RepID=B9SIK5_RICCO|nr:flavonoid 3-hydroxylase, putative [Ricinus communis]